MNLNNLEQVHNITFIGEYDPEEIVNSRTNRKISFIINRCNHEKEMSISTLYNHQDKMVYCPTCKKYETTIRKYHDLHNLVINPIDFRLECLECDRKYNREHTWSRLVKDVNKFNCYCKLKRNNELIFFDRFSEVYGDNFYKSYNGYNTGSNHSSDFYIKHEGKIFILHLDDNSHGGLTNRESDLYKLGLCENNLDIYNIYIHQAVFTENPELVQECIEEVINDYYEMAHTIIIQKANTVFYDYIKDNTDYWELCEI